MSYVIIIFYMLDYSLKINLQVNAVYVFDVEGEGKWHVDLTSGKGEIGKGDLTTKPDVTIVVNKETFLKVPRLLLLY